MCRMTGERTEMLRENLTMERNKSYGKLLSFAPSNFYCFQIPKCVYIHIQTRFIVKFPAVSVRGGR